MPRIRREDIDRLRRQADMVAVASDHTRLKRAGQRLKGLCPFHDEKTPSFTIDPSQNLYHCFGCGAGGDIYDFLMELEGLEFVEAVEQLARRTGFSLHYEELSPGEKRALGRRTRIVEVNRAAMERFRDQLWSDEGEVARDYLSSRGFTREDAEHFDLGFAPNEWDRLTRHLLSEGHDRRLLTQAGLAKEGRSGRIRDRFRGRLIFPVLDVSGDPIGFGGRVVPGIDYGDFDPPKYYNSPDTPVYDKSRVLYGLHRGRAEIVRADQVLVCEGYTDVIALHQAGFGRAVATCGTAVGTEHLRVLSRYADEVVLAFDADAAGSEAVERAWERARQAAGGDDAPVDLRVLVLPEGTDPADPAADEGVGAVREAVAGATPVLPFLLRRVTGGGGDDDERDRAARLREAVTLLGAEPDPELRRAYAEREVARPLGLSIGHVEKTAARQEVALDAHEGADPGALRPTRAERGGIATDRHRARLERQVLRAALQRPEHLPDEWDEVTGETFTHPRARELYGALQDAGGAGAELSAVIEAAADDELRQLVREVGLEDPDGTATPEAARDLVTRLLADHLRRRRAGLREELERVRRDTDPERWRELNRELAELEQRRKALLRRT